MKNLYNLTGQESGIVVYGDGDKKAAIVCNWATVTGLPWVFAPGLLVDFPLEDGIPEEVDGEHRDNLWELLDGAEILYNANDDLLPQSGTVYKICDNIVVIAPDGWC